MSALIRLREHGGALRRFTSASLAPEDAIGLREDHPALSEARSIFPHSVDGAMASKRFLVSGHNNPKLGAKVLKGPWKDYPIFHLTLEERATCPRSCQQWATCYGNAMPMARRHDFRDPRFLELLRAEVLTVARANPGGFVVRLHTLGDFFSVDYVRLWADLLDELPNLRVFGYTARREDADDDESRLIARALRWLTEQAWDVFAIRFSGDAAPQGSIVIDDLAAVADDPAVIVCPAQQELTDACATCGLCWSAAAREKTIAFIRHGMTRRRTRSQAALLRSEERAVLAALKKNTSPLAVAEVEPKRPKKPAWGWQWRPRASLDISPKEQEALIAEAVAAGKVRVMPPGTAWGVEAQRVGIKQKWIQL
ncbi:MAG TPA: hypothetical protein PKY87_14585 [Terricaulis sp.]|nr:hypothetical protein [Terricaulis sp.]